MYCNLNFQAINSYQLLFFLVANVATGLINLSIDTDEVESPYDILIVIIYTMFVCSFVTVLYNRNNTKLHQR